MLDFVEVQKTGKECRFIQGPLYKWTKPLNKSQFVKSQRRSLWKTPKVPFGGMFWTIKVHVF